MAMAAIIGLVLIWQGIISGRVAIHSKVSEILDKKAFIGAYSQRVDALPIVLNNYSSAKEKIDMVNERFVSGTSPSDVDMFFSELEALAFTNTIVLEKVFIENPEVVKKTDKKTADKKETETPAEKDKFLRLTTKGKYENILNFIYNLEAMPYYIDIKSVSINSRTGTSRDLLVKKEDDFKGELQAIIVIKVFNKQDINEAK